MRENDARKKVVGIFCVLDDTTVALRKNRLHFYQESVDHSYRIGWSFRRKIIMKTNRSHALS